MDYKKYNKLIDELIDEARQVSRDKGQDYTVGSQDALANFKTVAERNGLDPMKVLGIYMMKHQDAIANYIRTGGQSESEPIKMRIIDNINYLCLLWGLVKEEEEKRTTITKKYYENKISEKQGKETTKRHKGRTINFIPDAGVGGYKIYHDGGVGEGYTVVSESDGEYSIRYRGEEHGEAECLGDDGTGRAECGCGENPSRSFQKESQ